MTNCRTGRRLDGVRSSWVGSAPSGAAHDDELPDTGETASEELLEEWQIWWLEIAELGRPWGYGVGICGACGEQSSVPVVIRGERAGVPLRPWRKCRICGAGRISEPWPEALELSSPWPTRRRTLRRMSDTPDPDTTPEPEPADPSEPEGDGADD